MSDRRQDYFSYLLRIWRMSSGQTLVWRASLEHPQTGERLSFTSLPRLFAFLEDQCTVEDRGEDFSGPHGHAVWGHEEQADA